MAADDLPPEPFDGHDHGVWAPVPSEVVASWPAGHFAENLVIDRSGTVLVSLFSHSRIDRYDPATGNVTLFAKTPAPVAGLAFDGNGTLWATGGRLGDPPGYVWRFASDGQCEEWVRISDARFMNGCALHPNGRTLLVCESVTGRILAVDLTAPAWDSWITDDLLRPCHEQMPGANGIKLRDGSAWISVTDSNLLVRAPIRSDGRAGDLQITVKNLRADDFAFDADGALYVTTHPANTVLRLAPDGSRTTIAGPAQGVVGSTACAFGRGNERASLYVTTNGGMWAPYHGQLEEAKLVRLEPGPGR
jgi:sugar lactone lactonase YvrE